MGKDNSLSKTGTVFFYKEWGVPVFYIKPHHSVREGEGQKSTGPLGFQETKREQQKPIPTELSKTRPQPSVSRIQACVPKQQSKALRLLQTLPGHSCAYPRKHTLYVQLVTCFLSNMQRKSFFQLVDARVCQSFLSKATQRD